MFMQQSHFLLKKLLECKVLESSKVMAQSLHRPKSVPVSVFDKFQAWQSLLKATTTEAKLLTYLEYWQRRIQVSNATDLVFLSMVKSNSLSGSERRDEQFKPGINYLFMSRRPLRYYLAQGADAGADACSIFFLVLAHCPRDLQSPIFISPSSWAASVLAYNVGVGYVAALSRPCETMQCYLLIY